MVSNRVGPAVRGEDFFGRESFVQLVSDKLRNGHVLLAALRRFGKTSVMYRLLDQPLWGYRAIHLDLEHFEQPADFITALVEKLAKDATLMQKLSRGLKGLPASAMGFFRRNLGEVELYEVKIGFREEVKKNWRDVGDILFRQLAETDETVLFVLDELAFMIQTMVKTDEGKAEAKALLRWLRALRMNPDIPNVRFLVASSIGIERILNDLGEIGSINDFEKIKLTPFTPTVADQFLDALAAGNALSLDTACKSKMLELIGPPVPYFVQILFSETQKASARDGESPTPERIEAVYREEVLGATCKSYFDHYYGRLRANYRPNEERAVRRILRELARAGTVGQDICFLLFLEQVGSAGDDETFSGLMADLENDFYVRFNPTAGGYEFSCKLLRDWWLRHYGMGA